MNKKKFITAVLLSLAFTSRASASGAIAGATEPTQIMNHLELVASYVEQAEQTVTQMAQYQTMLKNLMQMKPSALLDAAAQKLFSDQKMYNSFKQLQSVVVNGQRIAYSLSNLESKFKQIHPGYGMAGQIRDFAKAYRDWSDNTLGSVENAMTLVAAHAEDFDSEQEMLGELQNRTSTAQGQMQVIQAGNQIGLAMMGQMQKLRQLQMAQMQAQNAYLAGQQSRNDVTDAQLQKYIDNAKAFKPEVSTGKGLFK